MKITMYLRKHEEYNTSYFIPRKTMSNHRLWKTVDSLICIFSRILNDFVSKPA